MFVSTNPEDLFLQRDADGNLPRMDFLRAKTGTPIALRHQGWAWEE